MAQPINMALYRLLLKQPGISEAEAEEAARVDASDLATKADLTLLRADLSALKSDLIMWMAGLTVAQLLGVAALLVALR